MFPASALHKETNVKKIQDAMQLLNVAIDNASIFFQLTGYEDEHNKYENLVICNDGAI